MATIQIYSIPQAAGSIYSNVARLHIYTNYIGPATISVNPSGAILFPAIINITQYETEIEGEIKQFGTHTVTVTANGVSDTVEVEVLQLPNNIYVGPEIHGYYDGNPITFQMVANCDRPNTTLNISTTGAGITAPSTVYCDGAIATFNITISNYGNYSITASYDSEQYTNYIYIENIPVQLYLEAPKNIYIEDLPVTIQMRAFCSRDGIVTLSSSGTGVIIPDHIEIVNGSAVFDATFSQSGIKIISAVYGDTYAETSIVINEEAIVISLGEDRHVQYRGEDITITKTVYCNKEGIVFLSGELVDIPDFVVISNGKATFDITVHSDGEFLITAAHEKDVSITTTCKIISELIPIRLSLGEDRTHYVIGEESLTIPMNVYCNWDGTVLLSSDYATVPPSVNVVNGFSSFNATCNRSSIITAQFLNTIDTCNIQFIQRPSIVKIGPNGTNINQLQIVTNRPGVVYLSTNPIYGYEIPSSVVIDDSLEATVTATLREYGNYVVTAIFGAASDSCTIEYPNPDHIFCRVYGTMLYANGKPVRNEPIIFEPKYDEQFISGKLVKIDKVVVRTDMYGKFSAKLYRGSKVIINGQKIVTIPDQESIDYKDL